jgi:hypothetical protein
MWGIEPATDRVVDSAVHSALTDADFALWSLAVIVDSCRA